MVAYVSVDTVSSATLAAGVTFRIIDVNESPPMLSARILANLLCFHESGTDRAAALDVLRAAEIHQVQVVLHLGPPRLPGGAGLVDALDFQREDAVRATGVAVAQRLRRVATPRGALQDLQNLIGMANWHALQSANEDTAQMIFFHRETLGVLGLEESVDGGERSRLLGSSTTRGHRIVAHGSEKIVHLLAVDLQVGHADGVVGEALWPPYGAPGVAQLVIPVSRAEEAQSLNSGVVRDAFGDAVGHLHLLQAFLLLCLQSRKDVHHRPGDHAGRLGLAGAGLSWRGPTGLVLAGLLVLFEVFVAYRVRRRWRCSLKAGAPRRAARRDGRRLLATTWDREHDQRSTSGRS
eukprot:scaffold870_cov268-Pinguiococcus_pyrenoidosus.AAC.30